MSCASKASSFFPTARAPCARCAGCCGRTAFWSRACGERSSSNPGYAALAEGLKQFISPEAANLAALSLSDPVATKQVFEAAGFAKVEVKVTSLDVTFPSSAALVDWMAGGSHSTRQKLALIDHAKRQQFYAFVASHLTTYKTDDGLRLPTCRNVCVASGRR